MSQAIIDSEIFRDACYDGKLNIVMKYVIEKGIDINEPFYEEDGDRMYKLWTPLRMAVYRGQYEIVNFLLSCPNINIDHKDMFQRSALSIACNRDFTDMFKFLLLHGAKIPTTMCGGTGNADIGCSVTLLSEACWNANSDIVGHLIDSDVFDINEQDSYGRTALHIACDKPLITANDSPNDQNVVDLNFCYDCIALLLLNMENIDVTLKDSRGKTAYEYYTGRWQYVCNEIIKAFEDACLVKPSAPLTPIPERVLHLPALPSNSKHSAELFDPFEGQQPIFVHNEIDKDLQVTKDFPFAEVQILETPVQEFLKKHGVEHLYTDELEQFENECSGKNLGETIIYNIFPDFVKIWESFGFGIELRYFEYTKLLQLSCYCTENVVSYTTNGKDYLIHSPKIVFEEQIHYGTTCGTMYIHKFTPPPMLGWGWKIDGCQHVVRNKDTFNEAFVNLILRIT